eukprot:1787037-Rhodomonas_salina.1
MLADTADLDETIPLSKIAWGVSERLVPQSKTKGGKMTFGLPHCQYQGTGWDKIRQCMRKEIIDADEQGWVDAFAAQYRVCALNGLSKCRSTQGFVPRCRRRIFLHVLIQERLESTPAIAICIKRGDCKSSGCPVHVYKWRICCVAPPKWKG